MADKIRVTLDLSPAFYERLEALERFVDGGTKANVIRQALMLYERMAQRSLEGCSFVSVNAEGVEEKVVFLGGGVEVGTACLGKTT